MLGDEIKVFDKRLHRRVETVAVTKLKREAFADAARHDADRFKALTDHEDGFDIGRIGAERGGDLIKVGRAIASLVCLIDKSGRNQLVRLREAGHGNLFVEVLVECRFRAQRAFEIIIIAGKAAASAGLRPVGAG